MVLVFTSNKITFISKPSLSNVYLQRPHGDTTLGSPVFVSDAVTIVSSSLSPFANACPIATCSAQIECDDFIFIPLYTFPLFVLNAQPACKLLASYKSELDFTTSYAIKINSSSCFVSLIKTPKT